MKARIVTAAIAALLALSAYQASAIDVQVGGAVGQPAAAAQGATNAANAPLGTLPPAASAGVADTIHAGGPTGLDGNGRTNIGVPAVGVQVQPNLPGAAVGVGVQTPGVGVDVRTQGEVRTNIAGNRELRNEARLEANITGDNRPDQWRYKQENGRWWYWTPDNRWMWYSDQGGWTYFQPSGSATGSTAGTVSGSYTTGYGGVTVAPDTQYQYSAPGTTYYYPNSGYVYPNSGYYYRSYPGRYYYGGGSGLYIGGNNWGVRVGGGGRGRW